MGESKCLQWYTKVLGLNYPETIGEVDIEILNNGTFHSLKKTKFDIDMSDIEKEKSEIYFYQVDEEEEGGEGNVIPNKEKVCILNIDYTYEEKLSYGLLCSLIEQKLYSFEGYIISTIVILSNSSYYSAWVYRRKCLKYLDINLLNELKFTRSVISANIKSFQSWFHRRWLVEYIYRWNEIKERKPDETTYKTTEKNKMSDDINLDDIDLDDIDLDDPSNFLSSDENEEDTEESHSHVSETKEDIIFNCDEKCFRIEKKSPVLNKDLQNITEKYIFFKNAIKSNEQINMNKLLYEEILYNNCDIFLDKKNYNSWAYKCWLIEHFQIFKNEDLCKNYNVIINEFQLVNYLLKNDIYNNSVWIYRYFIFNKMDYIKDEEKLEKEILFCINYAKIFFDNEAIFNYFTNIVFKYLKIKKNGMHREQSNIDVETRGNGNVDDIDSEHIFDITLIQHIYREFKDLRRKSKFILLFLAQLYAYNKSYNEEIECYKYLKQHDHFNEQIWKYIIEETKQKRELQK